MIPGEVIPAKGEIELNRGARTVTVKVANTGDRPVQVGSHYHFFETNPALDFDREKARGMRLDIAAGTAVRFEPGQARDVTLVPFSGGREAWGFRKAVMGRLCVMLGRFAVGVACAWLLMPLSVHACGGAPVCTVSDPTGTPLNIRTGPNGKVVGTARNGTRLEFIDHVEHGGKLWARVARFDPDAEILSSDAGILFLDYLDCGEKLTVGTYQPEIVCKVADPTGTPLNIRDAPNGAIMGTVRNGETVRVYAVREHKGKLWAEAWRDPADNAVGWVFDDYLKCEEDGH